jgi:hypothetical protein
MMDDHQFFYLQMPPQAVAVAVAVVEELQEQLLDREEEA